MEDQTEIIDQRKNSIMPFRDGAEALEGDRNKMIQSREFITPFGKTIFTAECQAKPEDTAREDDIGIYLDDEGKVQRKPVRELFRDGYYEIAMYAYLPISRKDIFRKNLITGKIWIPDTDFESTTEVESMQTDPNSTDPIITGENDESDEYLYDDIIADFNGQPIWDKENKYPLYQQDKPLLTKEQLRDLHFNVESVPINADSEGGGY